MRCCLLSCVCLLIALCGCGQQEKEPPAAKTAQADPAPQPHEVRRVETPAATVEKTEEVEKSEAPAAEASAPAAEPPAPKPLSVTEISDRVDDGVVLLRAKNPFGEELGFGSGFVIEASGLLLTNYHVVSTASSVEAEFQNGEKVHVSGYRAWDADADVAILQLEKLPSNVEVLPFSDQETLARGAEVVVFGHPEGLRFSTAKGVISAIQKTEDLPETFRAYLEAPDEQLWIQTDMSAAGGSSGGPLLDRQGRVIGMVTLTATRLGMSFAVHLAHLKEIKGMVGDDLVSLTSAAANKDPYTAALGEIDTEILKVVKNYRRSVEELQFLAQNARTPKERQEVVDKHPAKKSASELVKFAKEHAHEPQKRFQALLVAIQVGREALDAEAVRPTIDEALEQLLTHYSQDERLGSLAVLLAYSSNPNDHQFLRRLLQQNSSDYVQAMGLFALASGLAAAEPETAERNAEVVSLLERIERDYKDAKYGGYLISESAEPLLYQRKYLGIGSSAPEIEGKDSQGEQFKLSDFRGKVVLLDFWGDWCPYCVKMYPAGRLLVKKFADKPFALLGVNTDEKERFEAAVREQKVTWRSWHDGPMGAGGAIASTYRIDAVPMTYLLDADGVIRQKFSGLPEGNALEAAVQRMLDEMIGAGPVEAPVPAATRN